MQLVFKIPVKIFYILFFFRISFSFFSAFFFRISFYFLFLFFFWFSFRFFFRFFFWILFPFFFAFFFCFFFHFTICRRNRTYSFYYKKCGSEMQFEICFSVAIGFQFILYRLDSTAITVYKTENFHSFCHHSIAVVVDIWKILRGRLAIQTSGIHYFYTIIILIELNRAISFIISVTYGIHQKLAGGPMRVIHYDFLTKSRYRYRPAIGYCRIDKSIKLR